MPSRKQRRRRQKERRHEYEYVYVDDEGHELELEEVEPEVAKQNGAAAKKTSNGRSKEAAPVRRGSRTFQPPSWSRVLKRALAFAPLMGISIWLLDRRSGTAGIALTTFLMLVVFIPFSYMMDRMMYRRSVRQAEEAKAAKPARRN